MEFKGKIKLTGYQEIEEQLGKLREGTKIIENAAWRLRDLGVIVVEGDEEKDHPAQD